MLSFSSIKQQKSHLKIHFKKYIFIHLREIYHMKKKYTLLFFIVSLFTIGSAFAQSQNLVVKNYSQGELPAHSLHRYKNAIRTQYVQIDFSKLNEQSVFSLPLFDGQHLNFKYKNAYHYKTGSSSWYGQSTEGLGDVIFSFYQGNVKGIIKDNQMKKYMLQQIGLTDLFAITEVNVEAMQETATNTPDYIALPEGVHKKTRANADICAAGTTCPGASVIDLMVLGNADAISDAGGTVAAFITDVTSAVTEINTAYTTSGGTNLTFNLVHCDSYTFIATADPSADLSTFRNDAAVTTLRDAHAADLCGLWVGSGTYAGACGIGYLNTNPTNYNDMAAFTVTDYGCGMTNLTYAHECGHNMGLRHDYFVDGGTSPCDHHHGYTNQVVIPGGIPASGRWRTIMAYNNECSSNGFNCTRLARWANPSLTYLGDATGRAIGMPDPADEIYGFERFRCVVSEFRTPAVPLPVSLVSFKAEANGDQIILNWQTSSEKNSKGFDVEMHRAFNEDFAKQAFIAGKGNSSVTSDYKYTLDKAAIGTYYFRLKQYDLDGNYTYTNVAKVEVTGDGFQTSIYPNPAKDGFTFSFNNPKNQTVQIVICDMTGKEVLHLFDGYSTVGYHEIHAQTGSLQKGIYFCKSVAGHEKNVIKLLVE